MAFNPNDILALASALKDATPKAVAKVVKQVQALAGPDMTKIQKAIKIAAARNREALALYQELPQARAFHKCKAKQRLIDGSNQAGKTLAAVVEFARAITNSDPYKKFPKVGKALVVGLDQDHLADPMAYKLLYPGAFKTIHDEQTKLVRAVRPDPSDPTRLDPYDAAYREKWRDAPPLLPERCIKRVAWEDYGKGVPRILETQQGWTILWRASGGNPTQGSQWDFAWFDEEIEKDVFFVETMRGLMAKAGKFVWSATPQAATPRLLQLRRSAESGSEFVRAFKFLVKDNPYLSDEEKQAWYESLSEEERNVRWHGNYAILSRSAYPYYEPQGTHGCEPFEIPSDWTLYASVDPGIRNCATLFGAVDPDERHITIHDGFVLHAADANSWADAMLQRQGKNRLEAIVMDRRMGRQTHASGITVAEHYSRALKERGVRPRIYGPMSGFFEGLDDIAGRTEALAEAMRIRSSPGTEGTARLQKFRGTLGELDKEIENAILAKNTGGDEYKRVKIQSDLLDCLEYLVSFEPYYHPPETVDEDEGEDAWILQALKEKTKRMNQQR